MHAVLSVQINLALQKTSLRKCSMDRVFQSVGLGSQPAADVQLTNGRRKLNQNREIQY